ncbi:fatty acyl-AMP ligase [Streptomyces sp. NBC_00083]|uniref:fatty acyl-AMP ligase n=1 Tax=Streptomyces sp. NBC_00083 TaxID=2975647 RepID=UPI00225A351C|nr:fatty acyl-AMP ligase [Streptomyces sp. NBC_00083]MCX5382541.1 fatty acyl-AMP ligase [Streptomyces sp. NBC_00083]
MTPAKSFTQALAARFADRAAGTALLCLDGEGDAETRTYRELDARARTVAAALVRRRAAGRPVLISMDGGPHTVAALVGCLYAGAVAVPVPPPDASRAAAERTAAIAAETDAAVMLTGSAHAPELSRRLARAGRSSVVCLAVDCLPDGGDDWQPPALDGADTALLQYTSGSTAAPRGVQVTHANLLATMESLRTALGTDEDSRIGGWLPLHHDLGLIGQLLHPLWLGATAVLMSQHRYAADPLSWLREVARHRVTVTAAPDSAYARCLAAVTDEDLAALDLGALRTAVNASEPVSAVTLTAFAHRFAAAGLRPGTLAAGYGLAEATLLVTLADRLPPAPAIVSAEALERGELTPPQPGHPVRALAGCGSARDVTVRIVDPASSAVLPDGSVGEIWVRGEAVADGYWHRPLETSATFGHTTAAGEHGFLRTGDLGALRDGELYLTGRIKDALLVDGRTLHPQEAERQLAQSGAPFGSAVVLSAPADREQIVAIQEIRGAGWSHGQLADLAERVRGCLHEEFGASLGGVVLVRPGTVRRTTSGKVRRSLMRELYLRGELRPLYASAPPYAAEGG